MTSCSFPFQEMLESLKALSTFFNENSLRTRRNLRSDIERRSLSINEEFLQTFQGVKEVWDFFDKQNKICTEILYLLGCKKIKVFSE